MCMMESYLQVVVYIIEWLSLFKNCCLGKKAKIKKQRKHKNVSWDAAPGNKAAQMKMQSKTNWKMTQLLLFWLCILGFEME